MERRLSKLVFEPNVSRRYFSLSTKFLGKINRLPRHVLFVKPDEVVCDPKVQEELDADKYHASHHPGHYAKGVVTPPRQFEAALIKVAGSTQLESLSKIIDLFIHSTKFSNVSY